MRSITAVEIGSDTCALASTAVRGTEQFVHAAATLDPAAFPGIGAFASALEHARRSLKFPRRCRAVVWGLPEGATPSDPSAAPLIDPLVRAGFRVTRVVTPCNALGALARLRTSRGDGGMCWLGINRNGVAIVVVRPGSLVYSHSFAWDSSIGATGSQARLLQRYSLVAYLAPEVRRAMAAARQKGTTVDGIITCGNLPDLRSLTMPLIEELDIEVETLDSLEGLQMKPALADTLSDLAPAIRLACAGAFAREARSVDEWRRRGTANTARRLLLAIAALALLASALFAWRLYARRPAPRPAPLAVPSRTQPAAAAKTPTPASEPPRSTGVPVTTQAAAKAPPPAVKASPPSEKIAPPAVTGITSKSGPSPTPSRRGPVATPPATARTNTPPPTPQLPPTGNSDAKANGRGAAPPAPELLKDPVPRVTAILVSADRRLASIGEDGQIIAVGDSIGRRVVVGIDDRTVLLREPSGIRIRVALGGRVVGVERPGR